MKKIKLTRPLITFDLETTGLNPRTDRIIEICIIKSFPDGRKKDEIKTRKINPERAIPEIVTKITGIKEADVKEAPKFYQVADSLAEMLKGCDVCGFNSNRFDVPFLLHEFERVGIYDAFNEVNLVDVFNLYCKYNPRTLQAAYYEYCGKTLDAHKAEEDAKATLEVLNAIINDHSDEIEDKSIEGLAQLSKRKENVDVLGVVVNSERGPVFAIGKHKGQLVSECRSYCDWILTASDFSANTKKVIEMILKNPSK